RGKTGPEQSNTAFWIADRPRAVEHRRGQPNLGSPMSSDFPVIDLGSLHEPQAPAAAPLDIVRQVARACEETAFFAVMGHGVPRAVIADLVAQSYTFFDLPLAEKLAVRRPRPEQNRGYIAPGEERLARLRGDETPPDLKELYTIGPFDLPDTPYFTEPASRPTCGRDVGSGCGLPYRPTGTNLTGLLAT